MTSVMDIKPNVVYVMTDELHSLFVAGGCIPTCHCCGTRIPVGDNYKLGSVTLKNISDAEYLAERTTLFKAKEPHEVMLCGLESCTANAMVDKAVDDHKRHIAWKIAKGGGCSIINGKIVT